ncbi:MAG: hypothetical protein SGJ24_03800 [Chloroflexota bacterium]|nr:hypothetical protein [Chloroflexota bacterium]
MTSRCTRRSPLITDTFAFTDSVQAFDYALHMPPTSVKVQIAVAPDQEQASS